MPAWRPAHQYEAVLAWRPAQQYGAVPAWRPAHQYGAVLAWRPAHHGNGRTANYAVKNATAVQQTDARSAATDACGICVLT